MKQRLLASLASGVLLLRGGAVAVPVHRSGLGQHPWRDDAGTPVTDFSYVNLVTATPLVPEGALGHFQDSDPNGTWTLSVTNDLAGDSASLDS